MKRIKIAILISIAFIVGIVTISLWANYKGRKPAEEAKLPRIALEGASSRLEKIRFVEEKQGRKSWELEANAMQQYQDQNVMVLEDIRLTFFNKDGRTFILTGRQGKVYQDTKNMELQGDVVVTSSDGYRLKTNSVAYDHQGRRIETADPIELDGEQLSLKGRGMRVDMEAQTVRVFHDVRTQWKAGKKG